MTTRAERAKALGEIQSKLSDETLERIEEQAKKVAANMMLQYGDKSCLSASGFIYCMAFAAECALCWAAYEGLVSFSDDAFATEDELAKRREAKHEELRRQGEGPPAAMRSAAGGAYL